MSGTWFTFRAEWRRRWRSWLVLAALAAMVGGVVMAAAAAGSRTASAFPRFVADHGYDELVFNVTPLHGLSSLPGVESVLAASNPANGSVSCNCAFDNNDTGNFDVLSLSTSQLNRLVKLVAGQMPSPTAPDQVLASFDMQQYGVHIGSVIRMPFFGASQIPAVLAGSNVRPAIPTVSFNVVGIAAAEPEFAGGVQPEDDLYTSVAFNKSAASRGVGTEYFVRLRGGASDLPDFTSALNGLHPLFSQNDDSIVTAVEASIHPQAVGWWVLAVLAAIVGMAVVGQALARQSAVERQEYPVLSSLGMSRQQLVVLGVGRDLVIAVAGAVGAVVVAYALSPLAPVGEARVAEPHTGLAFDATILLLGALVTVVVVVLLGLWPAVLASRQRLRSEIHAGVRTSRIVTRVAEAGAPPAMVMGVRHALERGRGASSVPVGTALLGTVLAVIALCATAVFGSSLTHLTATPALYGDDYQISFANNSPEGGPTPQQEIAELKRNRAISGIMLGTRAEVSIRGVSVYAIMGQAIRGPLLISKVSGHAPSGTSEVDLGATTLREVGAHLGSWVNVTVQVPTGGTRTVPFRVVGITPFPGSLNTGSIGTGAAFTLGGYLDAACPVGAQSSACRSSFEGNNNFAVLASTVGGTRGAAAVKHYIATGFANLPTAPNSLVNFGEAVNFPLILGIMVALFGVATLLHLLVVSVARRRTEIGLLKALGFVNGQVGATVCWQATTVALVGVVVGVPLGIVVGHAVWDAFAANLGAVGVVVVPTWILVALGVGVLIVSNLLALVPALVAARSKGAVQLLQAD